MVASKVEGLEEVVANLTRRVEGSEEEEEEEEEEEVLPQPEEQQQQQQQQPQHEGGGVVPPRGFVKVNNIYIKTIKIKKICTFPGR